MVAEGHGLRRLQMREARHDHVAMRLRLARERELQARQAPASAPLDPVAHVELEVGRHLVVARARRVQPAGRRADQVALDFRLWVREACDRRRPAPGAAARAAGKAEAHADTLMPGFTHLQPAQPVTFGHHLMAYVEMFGRDARASPTPARG